MASIAPLTARAYEWAIKDFESFSTSAGWGLPWPVQEALLLRFLAHLRERGLSHTTLAIHISTIAFYSKALGFPNPSQSFLARKAMEGWRWSAPQPPDKRKPVTPALLRHLIKILPRVCTRITR